MGQLGRSLRRACYPKRYMYLRDRMAIGKNKDKSFKDCPTCRGEGKVRCPECKGYGRPFDCGHCSEISKGESWGYVPCKRCDGSGEIKRV